MITFKFSIKDLPQSLKNGFADSTNKIKGRVLEAMGAELIFIAHQNFGNSGVSRPSPWPKLSDKYAKRVGRTYPTLDLDGALFRSFRMDVRQDAWAVDCYSVDVPYADRHQYGRNMPLRPYWPIDKDGQLTEYAKTRIIKQAISTTAKALAS